MAIQQSITAGHLHFQPRPAVQPTAYLEENFLEHQLSGDQGWGLVAVGQVLVTAACPECQSYRWQPWLWFPARAVGAMAAGTQGHGAACRVSTAAAWWCLKASWYTKSPMCLWPVSSNSQDQISWKIKPPTIPAMNHVRYYVNLLTWPWSRNLRMNLFFF